MSSDRQIEEFESNDHRLSVLQLVGTVGPSFGGPSHGLLRLNTALSALPNVSATVMTVDYADPTYRRLTTAEIESIASSGAQVRIFTRSRPFKLQASWALARALKREMPRTALLHMHGQYLFPHVAGYLLAKHYRTPFGIQLHGSAIRSGRARSRTRRSQAALARALYDAVVGRRVRRDAKYLMCSSELEADALPSRSEQGKAFVAPLGVDLDPANTLMDVEVQLAPFPRSQCVLYLGRLAKFKHPDRLLEAWPEVNRDGRFCLVIAGPDGDVTSDDLRSRARELGVSDSVVLPGLVSGGHKTWLYDRCGTFILPSETENFGLVIAEALSRGAYVMAGGDAAAIEHAIAAGSGHALPDLSEGTIALELRRVLHGKVLDSAQRQVEAREYCARFLTWSATARAVIAQLTSVEIRP